MAKKEHTLQQNSKTMQRLALRYLKVKPLWTMGLCHIQPSAELWCTYRIPDTSQLPAKQPITDALPIQLKLCFRKCRLLWQKIRAPVSPKSYYGWLESIFWF